MPVHFLCFLFRWKGVKVSEYLLSKIKFMLKKHGSPIYTYFYNIFLNVVRITFSIYIIYLFYALQISEKLGSKLRQKLTTFPIFGAPLPTELQFSIIFFHWHTANQETNKPVPTIFLNIFWIINFYQFSCKIRWMNYSNEWITHY